MADTRKPVSTHFVVRVVVEQVDITGVYKYGESVPDPVTVKRNVQELGTSTVKNKSLKKALDMAHAQLDTMDAESL